MHFFLGFLDILDISLHLLAPSSISHAALLQTSRIFLRHSS